MMLDTREEPTTNLDRVELLNLSLNGMNVGSAGKFTFNLLNSSLLVACETNDGVVRIS